MCGVPYHAANSYIKRLIDRGHKVAVCDQLEDPALTKGLVKRDVIRVITPGTLTDEGMLDFERPNYICALWLEGGSGGAAFCEVSTGEFCAADFPEAAEEHDGFRIVRNAEQNRLQILFDGKPDEATRSALKQNGFRWSPRNSAWQRQLTDNAERAARRALGLE